MKIISGQLKGRNFYMPAGIRPTQGIARKALFDILGHDMSGITLLDLFAGSGAIMGYTYFDDFHRIARECSQFYVKFFRGQA